MCNLFYIPGVNGLIGNFLCIGVKVEGGDPKMAVPLNCKGSTHIMLMVICSIFLLGHIVISAIVRLFLFSSDMRKGDFWTC
jgi:hypothetical protein